MKQSFIKKTMNLFLKLIMIILLIVLSMKSTSKAFDIEQTYEDKVNNMVKKTEIITTFDWIKDVDPSIGSITIEEEGRKVQMTGNESLPGKNAIYIIPESHQEQNFTFDYSVDYGDSFNAAGLLLKVRENEGYLEGYLLSFNNPGGYSDWYSGSDNKLGAIWTVRYKLGDNKNENVEKTLVKAVDIPVSGNITVKATQEQIFLTWKDTTETIDITQNEAKGDGFGFFTDHYSHGCNQIGYFALTNFGLQTVDLIPHDFIIDPNGGVWNGSEEETAIEGIYKDTVDVPLPTREGYTFVKWTKIGNSGTMSSLTEDATYIFGENEEIDDKIIAEWIKITGEKTSNVENGKVKVGDTITYKITLKNEGTVDGKAVINDTAPEGTQFVENSIKLNGEETQYTLENLNNGIEVNIPKGESIDLTFDVIVNDLNDDDIISNVANYKDITVTGKESSGETNKVDLMYVEPIISFEKTATSEYEKDYVVTGEKIEYKITVQNAGGLSKDVVIKDVIPEGTTFVEGSIKIDDVRTEYKKEDLENGIKITAKEKIRKNEIETNKLSDMLNLINMNTLETDSLPGETVLTFEVTVDDQKDENEIKNIATVDDVATNEVNYTYRKPIISSKKEINTENDLDYVVSKENIEYSIVVNNYGSIPKNVVIEDNIPDGTTFAKGTIEVNGEKTDYTKEDLEEGIEVEVPGKHLKEEITEDDEKEEQIDDEQKDNKEDDVENKEENATSENEEINTLLGNTKTTNDDKTNENDKEEEKEENQEENEEISDEENDNKTEDKENNNEEDNINDDENEIDEDANLQENEEPGQIVLTFNVLVNDLKEDTQTKEITNIAKVDDKETNKTSIEVLPFNMKVEIGVDSFTVNGKVKQNNNPDFVKTDIDMRKSSPTPDVTANIKIKVTNTGKIEGKSVVEATIPEGFTLVSSNWTQSGSNTVRTETNKIQPGKTEEISLDVKWVNNENNLGERTTTAEIIETSNEAKAGETTTEDNESKADMIISIVTGEYDNIVILSVIGIIALLAIIGEVILIRRYVL